MHEVFGSAGRLKWLSDCALFKGIPDQDIEFLNPHFSQRTVSTGTLLMVEAQNSTLLNIIVEGTVKATVSRRGRTTQFNIAGPSDVLGELSLLDGAGHSADIVTLEETTLLWIDRIPFESAMLRSPQLCLNLAKTVTRRLRQASARIEALSTLDVQGRVAHQLLQFAHDYGVALPPNPHLPSQNAKGILIPLCLTQSDLADLTGATRTRVNQVLTAMRQSNLIAMGKNHHVTLLEPELLERRFVV